MLSVINRSLELLCVHVISEAGEDLEIGLNDGQDESLKLVNFIGNVVDEHLEYHVEVVLEYVDEQEGV